jgi:hypothetical protein
MNVAVQQHAFSTDASHRFALRARDKLAFWKTGRGNAINTFSVGAESAFA